MGMSKSEGRNPRSDPSSVAAAADAWLSTEGVATLKVSLPIARATKAKSLENRLIGLGDRTGESGWALERIAMLAISLARSSQSLGLP